MAIKGEALKTALLELGLEDLIPVWEALTDPEVVRASNTADRQRSVAGALLALADAARISLYVGPWNAEPERISPAAGRALLNDSRWFDTETEPNGQRLYFVNVENIPDD